MLFVNCLAAPVTNGGTNSQTSQESAIAAKTAARGALDVQDFRRRKEQSFAEQDRIAKLASGDRKRAILNLPKGVYVNLPEFWSQVRDPNEIFDATNMFGEPLSADMLDALQRALPALSEPYKHQKAAAVLYSHHRSAGEVCLLQDLIDRKDLTAAQIFADNHDITKLHWIMLAATANPDDDDGVLQSLAQWHDDTVNSALAKFFQSDPSSVSAILAVAATGQSAELPDILTVNKSTSVKSNAALAMASTIAIAKLDESRRDALLPIIESSILGKAESNGTVGPVETIRMVGEADLKQAVPSLVEVIGSDVQEIRTSNDWLYISSHVGPAIAATDALTSMGDTSSQKPIELLLQVLSKVDKSHALKFHVALDILRLGGGDAILQEYMGPNWLQKRHLEQSLRKIPLGDSMDVVTIVP